MCPPSLIRHSVPLRKEGTVTEPQERIDGQELVTEDLVEEVSIDGMCGVY
jgi:mycofactocin precursor